MPGPRGFTPGRTTRALGKHRAISVFSSKVQAAVVALSAVSPGRGLMDFRDIFECLYNADRLSLRSCSRLHAQLPVMCEMTWNYKDEPVPMTPRAYSNLRKRPKRTDACNNEVTVWGGRCTDCRKFACMWHGTRITLESFHRVTLCMPCQIARGMFK